MSTPCVKCGQVRKMRSRGLCTACYQASWRRGECAKYQRKTQGNGAKTQTFIEPRPDGSFNALFDLESEDHWALALLSPENAKSMAEWIGRKGTEAEQ